MKRICDNCAGERSAAARLALGLLVSVALVACEAVSHDDAGSVDRTDPVTSESRMSKDHDNVSMSPPDGGEPVSDPVFDGTHVSVGVISNGCTTADSFRIDHRIGDGVCLATVVRQQEDLCRRMPHVVQVMIPWQLPGDCVELDVTFTNPAPEALESLPGRRSPKQ